MRIGTPENMSPEQIEGRDIDQRSDIYSLGIVLYEMVTGRSPFQGETPFGVAHKQKTEPPPDPRTFQPQIPEEFGAVILKCLAKDANARYQTAAAAQRITRLRRSRKFLVPALVVAAAAVLAAIF
jgi:TolB-like protein